MQKWSSISGSVIGTSHSSRGEEKQDSLSVVRDSKGNISFCLSDGAGSSKHSKLSSSITAEFIANALSELPDLILRNGTGSWINDYIIQCVLNLRSELYDNFNTYDLRDYHCTLVSGVIFENSCIVAHIGDGAVISGLSDTNENQNALNNKLSLSEPENGEYKNETYFLTEPNWLKHLRIKAIPNVSWIIAGTDGGIDLLSVGDRLNDGLVSEFLTSLLSFSSDERNEQLLKAMSSKVANERTNDDKSLVIITGEDISDGSNYIWDSNGESLSKFYPNLQKKSIEKETEQKPIPSNSPSPISNPTNEIEKVSIARRLYAFFYQRTLLTISLILPLIIFFYFLISLYFQSSDEEKMTLDPQGNEEVVPLEQNTEQVEPSEETERESVDDKSSEDTPEEINSSTSENLDNQEQSDQETTDPSAVPSEATSKDDNETSENIETDRSKDEKIENTNQRSDTEEVNLDDSTVSEEELEDTSTSLTSEDDIDTSLDGKTKNGGEEQDELKTIEIPEKTQNETKNKDKVSDQEQQDLDQ